MNVFVAKLKRLLEDKKYQIIDLKPGHAYLLWVKSGKEDQAPLLEPILRNLKSMDIQMFVVMSEEAMVIECKD